MSETKEKRPDRRPVAPRPARGYPLASPIDASAFVRPLTGSAVLSMRRDDSGLLLDTETTSIRLLSLETTGFEGVDLPELSGRSVLALSEPTPEIDLQPEPEVQLEREVPKFASAVAGTPAAPVAAAAPASVIYEPLEFLDYDEEPYLESEYDSAVESEPQAEPEPAPPAMVVEPLRIDVRPTAPAPAKFLQGMPPVAMPAPELELARLSLSTVRPKLRVGKNPAAAKAPVVVPAKTPESPKPPVPTSRPAPAPQRPEASAASAVKPEPVNPPAPLRVEPPKVVPTRTESERQPDRMPAPSKPNITIRPAAAAPEKDKKGNRTSPNPGPVKIAARSNAVAVEREAPEATPVPAPAPPPKPKLMPIRKVDAPAAASAENPAATPSAPAAVAPAVKQQTSREEPLIGLGGSLEPAMSMPVKAGIAAAVAVVLAAGAYFGLGGSKADRTGPADPDAVVTDTTAVNTVIGGGGWTSSWGTDAAINKDKHINLYRPSMAMQDYRFEFKGQISRKALGWIFRAADSKNYYVMKLEMIKPGANPVVALVKYAVIDGKETTRTQVMLPFESKLDTLYDVRLDVRGDKFSTYVQGKLADYWTDDRIKVGGTGFYNDKGERAFIKSSQVAYLVGVGK